ncbi:MAG: response regulator transcription factor [Steroidobacter sp.]
MTITTASPIRTFVVDDHPMFRQGLRQAIESDRRFEVIGEAADGSMAIKEILKLTPDLAVLDINLPGANGIEIADALRAAQSGTRLVFLTMLQDEAAFNHAMSLGVHGYLLKDSGVVDIINCLLSVAAGNVYVSPTLSSFLLKRHHKSIALAEHAPGLDELTTAERRILKRIAEKKSTKQIAAEFNVSPRTVETHRYNICNKLELKGNNSLLQFAIEHRDALSALD